jgi:predicted aspartyl protease
MKDNDEMSRFSVDFSIANFLDVGKLEADARVLENVKHITLSGVVDSGAAYLVLPQRVADELRFISLGETTVRYADHRTDKRQRVGGVWLELLGRSGVYAALIEPNRNDALIGALVLEDLDLLVDCKNQRLFPRDPDTIFAEID